MRRAIRGAEGLYRMGALSPPDPDWRALATVVTGGWRALLYRLYHVPLCQLKPVQPEKPQHRHCFHCSGSRWETRRGSARK